MISMAAGAAGALVTLLLPGCWVTCGPWARDMRIGLRLSLALVLAPSIVALQYYVIRLAGFSFDTTSVLIPLINLPALYLIHGNAGSRAWPDARSLLPRLSVLALPVLYVAASLYDPQVATNRGHSWLHTDIIYMLANGPLRPEEPQLAGIGLAYPWTAHISEAVIARLMGMPPGVTYTMSHMAILVGIAGLVAAIVETLGGNRLARNVSIVLVCFGANWTGSVIEQSGHDTLAGYPILGDSRYTPWLRKFIAFESTVFGIGLCVALIWLASSEWPPGRWRYRLLLCAILLAALGTIYPVLFPAGLAVVLVRAAVNTVDMLARHKRDLLHETLGLAGAGIVAASMTALYVHLITLARTDVPGVLLTGGLWQVKVKAATMALVFLPLLVLALPVLVGLYRKHARPLAVLLGSWAACVALNVTFVIPHVRNEYKFVFPATAALAPIAAMSLGTVYQRNRRAGLTLALLTVAVFLAPPVWRRLHVGMIPAAMRPVVVTDAFHLRLGAEERLAPLVEAVISRSPASSVLVTNGSRLDLVTLTRRPLFVLPESPVVFAMGMDPDALLKRVRAYDPDLVDGRRAMVEAIYSAEGRDRGAALAGIVRESGRDLVLVLELPADTALGRWLVDSQEATRIHADEALQAWLVRRGN